MREKVIRGGTSVILRQIVSLPINALGIALTSRLLLPIDFGIQAILVPVIACAMMVVDLGTSQALVQSKLPAGPLLLSRVRRLKFINGFIITGVLALLSSWLVQAFSLPRSLVLLLPACGLLGWLQSQRAYQAVTLQRQVEWQTLARVEMVEIIAYNVILVAAAYLLRSAWCFVLALGLRMTTGAILLWVVSRRERVPATDGVVQMSALLRFGIPLQVTTLPSVAMSLVNPVVVGSVLGMTVVGLVNWSNYIVSLPMLAFQPFSSFLFSVLSAQRRRVGGFDSSLLASVTYMSMVGIAFLTFLTILLMPYVVHRLFDGNWDTAVPIAVILLAGNIVAFPGMFIAAQLTASGHSTSWLLINILSAILWWLFGALGAGLFGVLGFAVGTVIASFVAFFVELWIARKIADSIVNPISGICLLGILVVSVLSANHVQHLVSLPTVPGILSGVVVGTLIFSGLTWILDRYLCRIRWMAVVSILTGVRH